VQEGLEILERELGDLVMKSSSALAFLGLVIKENGGIPPLL
jgi:hypothetical protein